MSLPPALPVGSAVSPRRKLTHSNLPRLRIVRLASSPAGEPLEVNDTRMSGDQYEISYPISRDATAMPRQSADS
jgi:GntR family transcriptional regulator